MKKVAAILIVVIGLTVALFYSGIPVEYYRKNFSVNNVTVNLNFPEIGLEDGATVIGTLKIGTEGDYKGAYYLEVADIPDRYFNKDGKILIGAIRYGWKIAFRPVYICLTCRDAKYRMSDMEYRLCDKDEAIALIDDTYINGINGFKNNDMPTIRHYRLPIANRINSLPDFIYPEGEKPLFAYYNNKMAIYNAESHPDNNYYVVPYFAFTEPDDTQYERKLSQAKPCFTPYKNDVWAYAESVEEREIMRGGEWKMINKTRAQ
ncbi:MAG: hypothetical protein LBQ18_04285 [Campylobacteraceae bacterium]|nr:hypothetical protein [Campylobacteraceae bacterium]